ncbi:efflux RND transporter periplasmic adaptor subunit [Nitrospira lenta]|uniref:efflux RND transporter periplasmic adaptor subunit n=1 Tax=Nitrospira lenta TaxID=1436998 RepID=UPI0015E8995A|nr:efflux RND transporter periplasmic adaptor subunit [Nitrospira lenta]
MHPTPERPDPLKVGIHDADLDGLTIQREEQAAKRSPARSGGWRWWLLIVLLAGAVAVWKTGLLDPMPAVEVTAVVRMPAGGVSGLAATGYVVAQRQASIASKGTGRMEYLGVKVGDRVKEGEVIARLEHTDMDALLRQARAKLDVARAQLATAKPEWQDATLHFDRMKSLMEQSFATQSEFDMAGARLRRAAGAVKSAEAAIKAAEAEQQSAEVQVESTIVRAPFDGTVVKKFAEVGEVVAPMAASTLSRGSVVAIADMHSVTVDAEVSESMIHRVQAGQPVEIQLDSVPDHRYRGEVAQVMPIADRAKATILTRVRFLDLDEQVRPELSAKVTFGVRPGAAESMGEEWGVPSTAVVTKSGRSVVLLARDGTIVEQEVQPGAPVKSLTPVRGALSQTDEVVIAPSDSLRSGVAVTVHRRSS